MHSPLSKYKIGLAVIGLFTLVIVIVVIVQGSTVKQDNATYVTANTIANKLNIYIETSGTVPSSLAAAGVHNPPASISFTRLTTDSYRFCVDYKASPDSFDAGAAEEKILTQNLNTPTTFATGAPSDFLFINPDYHKGSNCQTVNTGMINFGNQGSAITD